MASTEAPTCVALYSHASREPRRVAEFRWSQESGVQLTVLDPEWGNLARQYNDHGVEYDRGTRVVHPEDGPIFMALLQPFRMSYYHFSDESERA